MRSRILEFCSVVPEDIDGFVREITQDQHLGWTEYQQSSIFEYRSEPPRHGQLILERDADRRIGRPQFGGLGKNWARQHEHDRDHHGTEPWVRHTGLSLLVLGKAQVQRHERNSSEERHAV